MTSSIGLSGMFADVVILLTLAAAVASSRVSQLARPVIATFAFVVAWLIGAVLAAMRAPGWTLFMGGAVIVVSIVVITATLYLWTRAGESGESGAGHRDDHGGGGARRLRPDPRQPGGGGGDPSWWPEFERQLALYVAEREREKRQPAVAPAEPAAYAVTRPRRRHGVGKSGCTAVEPLF